MSYRNNKNQSSSKSLFIVLLILIAFAIFKYFWSKNNNYTSNSDGLDRNATITYSKHAKCRMDCRHIDRSEVNEILKEGKINERKSQVNQHKFALEGITHDKQKVRIVFAFDKPNRATVVTCIDLDTDWSCDCY